MVWGKLAIHRQKIKLDPYFRPYTEINSKQIEDFKVRPKIVKLLEENTGGNFHEIGVGNNFIAIIPRA